MSAVPVLRPPSQAALRNRAPIVEVLARVLPPAGLVLEIASGGGEHVSFFAQRMPTLAWQPTERAVGDRAQVDARVSEAGVTNVRPALALDVLDDPWPIDRADALVCINMIHASVPETVPALMRGAGRVLPRGGVLVTYGPYRIGGAHTAPSNEEFDAWLKRERDPRYGVRDLEAIEEAARTNGLSLEERIAMPANNFTLVWRRA
jgi:cyclopropane fatty-acyl-phospholipid synthase-like methyltransferase